MSENHFYSLFFFVIGAILFLAGLSNWDYFFKQRKAKFVIEKLGVNGARILYVGLGSLFITIALLLIFGVIKK